MRALCTALLLVSLVRIAAAQQVTAQIHGGAATFNFGSVVAVAGDYDLDGHPDVIVGTPLYSAGGLTHSGRFDVISGKTGAILHTELGTHSGDMLGTSVCSLGDRDGDGKPDFAAGAPFAFNTGAVIFVPSNPVAPNTTFFGAGAGDQFGAALALGPSGDLVVGAPDRDHGAGNEGSVYLLSLFYTPPPAAPGITASVITEIAGSEANEHFGFSVASGFDVNGDGTPDLVVGAPDHDFLFPPLTDAGQVRILSGKSPFGLITAKSGPANGARFGYSVALLQDADGDGRADYLVGAPFATGGAAESGVAFLYSGATGALLAQRNGSGASEHFGLSLSTAGDVNADGKSDYVIGAPDADAVGVDSGRVVVYGGGVSLPLFTVNGLNPGDRFGASVTGGIDTNGDGHAEFIVGAPNSDAPAAGGGSVQIRSGATGNLIAFAVGLSLGEELGASVAGLGDVDGDGFPDVAVGVPGADVEIIIVPPFITKLAADAGAVRIVSGKTGALIREDKGSAEGARFGGLVVGMPDVDGDGQPDYAAVGTSLASTLSIRSGATGATLMSIPLAPALDASNFRLACVGDINLDGVPDLAVVGTTTPGVSAVSGATGATLWTHAAEGSGQGYGSSLARMGDANGDGIPDVLVGARFFGPSNNGRGYVLSGVTGNLIRSHDGTAGQQLGYGALGFGDVNGDGAPDYVFEGSVNTKGLVKVFSGPTGVMLYQLQGTEGGWGASLALVGDADRDGVPDFVAGNPNPPTVPAPPGYVELRSGKTGALIDRVDGFTNDQNFGLVVASAGDIDHDGIVDVVIAAPNDHTGFLFQAPFEGAAYVVSLRPKGVSFYGASTPGCAGAELLTTNGVPTHGSATFEARCDKTPPSSLGLLLATNVPDLVGSDPFGFGIELHVDLFASTFLDGFDMPTSATGFGKSPLPIPSSSGLIGVQIYLQAIFAWSSGCSLPPFGLSASQGLQITIQ